MIPARFLTIPDCSCLGDQASEWLSTIRLLQFGGLLDCRCRALVIVSYPILFLPPAVSPSHRLPRLAYVIPLWHPLLFRVYVLYASDLHLLSLSITRSETSPAACKRGCSPKLH